LIACFAAIGPGCSTPARPDQTAAPPARLVASLFEPGPSDDRFRSDAGAVRRVRSGPDPGGVWTSRTVGPDEDSTLTLGRDADGSVRLLALVSGGRDVVCDPGLVLEPGDRRLPHAAESGCVIDGRSGTARAWLQTDPEAGPGGLVLTLEFEAPPVTARRAFAWRTDAAGRIVEEHAELGVTVLGLPVRRWSRSMVLDGPGP
jgi:hypothetical protein